MRNLKVEEEEETNMELRKFGEDEEADLELRKVGRMKMKIWIERLGFGGREMESWVMEASSGVARIYL